MSLPLAALLLPRFHVGWPAYVMCADLGATIGPLGGAWLYQHYGAGTPFYANGVILALCAVVLWVGLKVPGRMLDQNIGANA